MVYIKRIDLRGFKTFGKKATLKLGQGLTVITGPNGSGKSNVLDSLRFALGELSPKELRGSSLSDLVSKSNVSNPPKSAYVSVQFDNADRRLPMDAGSVTISREFYRGGEGVYRLNGRRVSRKQLTELLSSADIHVGGYNIVPQHAITRLAEVTSEERRKIVEDLVGLGVYDLKKTEAQIQLTQADTNLRIASARVDEVRIRVESLEKERNDYLRHFLLTKEIAKLQAQIISGKITALTDEIKTLREQTTSKESQLNDLKAERDGLSVSRLQIEQEMRSLQEKLVEKGGQKIHELEGYLSEINSTIGSLKADIEAKKMNLQLFKRQYEGLEQDKGQYTSELETTRTELAKLEEEGVQIETPLKEKETSSHELSVRIQEFKNELAEKSRILEKIERELELANEEFVKTSSQLEAESARITIVEDELKTTQDRGFKLQKSLGEAQKRRDELNEARLRHEEMLSKTDQEITKYLTLTEQRQKELGEATETAERANESILEFDAQKKIVSILAPEELTLAGIEELQASNILHSVVGRLRDLLQLDKKYEKAVFTACGDWLDAVVVKDLATAITCVEYLKRYKLGRIKIIPLDVVSGTRQITETPDVEGVISRLVDCVKYDASLEPAVNFVLGDTIVTDSQRSAYLSSVKGFRAVVLTGDLYEPGGAIEAGYYRVPLEISSIAPKPGVINDLKKTTVALIDLTEKAGASLPTLKSRVEELKEKRTGIQRSLDHIQNEAVAIETKLVSMSEEIARTNGRLKSLEERVEKSRESIKTYADRKGELEKTLRTLGDEKNVLNSIVHSEEIRKSEEQYSLLIEELNNKRGMKAVIHLKISSLKTAIESKAQILERTESQLSYIQGKEHEFKSGLEFAERQLETWSNRLSEVTLEREDLVRSLESLRESAANAQTRLDDVNEALRKAEQELEPLNSNLIMLRLELNKKELEENYLLEELGRLGFERSLEVFDLDLRTVEAHLSTLRDELQQIGAINALAVAHYEEQRKNYKQLSIRINQLEEEKRSILRFMEELDQKKRDTFMEVFNGLSRNFDEIFSKITDGGKGRLVLENPEDIFSAGVDMHLAFPGKAELSIGSASGGEKSVATVCFLLALQGIHPMPFYVFDEIDAHLDMVNSQRLADLLKERSTNSQFIVVSLKDTTISRAGGVYGIFIQDGFSQIVSLPKPEAHDDVRT
jgi:chromosome segregation protein